MVNPNFTSLADRKQNKATPPKQTSKANPSVSVTEKIAPWPGVGNVQKNNRSLGTPKPKVYPKKEGL